jgi:zinc-binding in reverse transcriptase
VAGGNCNYDISTHISDSQDTLSWKLTGHRTYTAYSFYNLIADTGNTRSVFPQLWKTKAPLSVKLFFYTLINDKLLTKQVMIKKKIQHGAPNCIMCKQCLSESALHLFFLCPYAISVLDGSSKPIPIVNNHSAAIHHSNSAETL